MLYFPAPSKFYEGVSKKRPKNSLPYETAANAHLVASVPLRIENWSLRRLIIGRWHTWGAWAGKWGDNSTSILPTSPLKTKHLKCFGRYSTKTSNRREFQTLKQRLELFRRSAKRLAPFFPPRNNRGRKFGPKTSFFNSPGSSELRGAFWTWIFCAISRRGMVHKSRRCRSRGSAGRNSAFLFSQFYIVQPLKNLTFIYFLTKPPHD